MVFLWTLDNRNLLEFQVLVKNDYFLEYGKYKFSDNSRQYLFSYYGVVKFLKDGGQDIPCEVRGHEL